MDLLATEGGTGEFYWALKRKVEKSCKLVIPQRLGRSVSVGQCKSELMDGFIAALDDAGMTALHTDAS